MNLASLVNRSTKLTALYENGDVCKVLPNAKINFLQSFDALKKQAALSIRLHKDEPVHLVHRMSIRYNGEDVEINDDVLAEMKSGKMTFRFSNATDKFVVSV